jgi:hypothetical protein
LRCDRTAHHAHPHLSQGRIYRQHHPESEPELPVEISSLCQMIFDTNNFKLACYQPYLAHTRLAALEAITAIQLPYQYQRKWVRC